MEYCNTQIFTNQCEQLTINNLHPVFRSEFGLFTAFDEFNQVHCK